jgi:hypothetical protein
MLVVPKFFNLGAFYTFFYTISMGPNDTSVITSPTGEGGVEGRSGGGGGIFIIILLAIGCLFFYYVLPKLHDTVPDQPKPAASTAEPQGGSQ